MYDNITFILSTTREPNFQKLSNLSKKEDLNNGLVTIKGKLKNLNISYRVGQLKISGSLAKYYLGDNIQTLTRKDCSKAIDQLGDDLELSIINAKVVRLEIATNLVMQRPVIAYLQCLNVGKRQKKNIYDSGITFWNKQRSIKFYDKLRELKDKKQNISSELTGFNNILRIELSYNSRLARQLKYKEIKASDLSCEKFYMLVINRLKKEYKFINKSTVHISDDINNVAELVNYLAFNGIKHLYDEPSTIFNVIDGYNINRQMKFRMKEKVKELLSTKNFSPLVDELNNKLNQSIFYYR